MNTDTLKQKIFDGSLHAKERRTRAGLGLHLLLISVAMIQLFPLLWLILFSFKDNAEIFGGNIVGWPHQLRWQNYNQALIGGKVGLYFGNSFLVTLITLLISGLLSAMASFAIARMNWKLNKITLNIFLLGLMIPIHAALLPLFMILRDLQLINSFWALIIPYVAFAMPMAVFVFTGFLQAIPREMEEAACLDGCTVYQVFYKIFVPLIKPAIATMSIFTYLSTWNELMFAVTFISRQELKTLTVGIMSLAGQYTTEWGPIGAGLVVATLPTVLVYILMSSQVQKSLTAGALKG